MSATLEAGNRTVEKIDPRLLVGEPTYLFNIYSNEYTVNTGTTGMWWIPPCPEGKEYVRGPKEVPGTVVDTYPHFTDSQQFRSRAVPGEDIVRAVLGVDNPAENITHFGVFASRNEKPNRQELDAAKRKLVPQLQKLLAQADQLFASPDAMEKKSVYDDKYFRAARYLNVKKPWLSEAAEMTLCPFCSIPVRPEASRCSGCGEIINQAAYEATKRAIQGAKA